MSAHNSLYLMLAIGLSIVLSACDSTNDMMSSQTQQDALRISPTNDEQNARLHKTCRSQNSRK